MREDTERVSDAFAALGDETRVEILEALVDGRREDPDDPGLAFSELRERVGIADSGRFNYHLGKLRGQFVEEGDGTYELTYAGSEVVGAILSGTPDPDLVLDPEPLDDPCPLCDTEMTAYYEHGDVYVECENDHTPIRTTLPPGAAADRSMTELLAVTARDTYAKFEHVTGGVCPECFGQVDRVVEAADVDDVALQYSFETVCERCGTSTMSALAAATLNHPAFVTLCHEHGIDVRERLPWQLPGIVEGDTERVQEDPERYQVRITVGDDVLVFTLDETASVLDHERSTRSSHSDA